MLNAEFDPDRQEIKILEASMAHVPFDGWGESALITGAEELGLEPDAVTASFPKGAIDAIALHSRLADYRMVMAFKALEKPPEKTHQIIKTLILLRLENAQPDKEAVRRALAVLALPGNVGLSCRLLYETVDKMWLAAGHNDTDLSFYTKRSILAAVYSSTVLSWLADYGGDLSATSGFLDRRLKDIQILPRVAKPVSTAAAAGRRFATAFLRGRFFRTPQ